MDVVEIYPVKIIGQGHLYVMPCPKTELLSRTLGQLHDLGINKVVSLLEVTEAERLGVEHEGSLCELMGIQFQQFPIPDHHTPNHPKQFRQLINELEQEIRSGSHIVVHCYAGIGRTGLVAGALLINDGLSVAVATDLLSDIRGCVVPQTHTQSNYLIDYAAGEETKAITSHQRQGNWFTRWLTPA